jgi:hypothetical protein
MKQLPGDGKSYIFCSFINRYSNYSCSWCRRTAPTNKLSRVLEELSNRALHFPQMHLRTVSRSLVAYLSLHGSSFAMETANSARSGITGTVVRFSCFSATLTFRALDTIAERSGESLMLSLGGGISGAAHVPLGKRSIRVNDDVAVALMERVVTEVDPEI